VADGLDLSDPDLFAREATAFAEEMSSTIRSTFGPTVADFEAVVSQQTDRLPAAFVRQAGAEGIHLSCGGMAILTMQVRIRLTADSSRRHLRVVMSKFDVTPYRGTEPIFRYEYERGMETGRLPAAHVQFHGRHKQLERSMAASGRTRSRSTSRKSSRPNLADLHFPLGGTRFRPCFEDVLEMLIKEFRVDVPDREAALRRLGDARTMWRQRQLRAAVRDDMESAASVLRSYGYQVTSPDPAPPVNSDRLRRI
jgi:hypothetical protein